MEESFLAQVQLAKVDSEVSQTFLVIPDPDDQSLPPQANYYNADVTEIRN